MIYLVVYYLFHMCENTQYSFFQLPTYAHQNLQHQIEQEYTCGLVRNICTLSRQLDNAGSNTHH